MTSQTQEIVEMIENIPFAEWNEVWQTLLEKSSEKKLISFQSIVIDEKVRFLVTLTEPPKETTKRKRKFGLLEGTPYYMTPDFNDPIEELADYM